ncbi:50S ribosomal protein L5 [Metallosphaera hakonensis]|uniref:Large ribosomal subunit protein uL5 n=1 Tax=Metallosphaera hakonensis JCM 8857 = DSM 7519 TaxID=1293036 RepID=A0A2U9ITL6_9CREN|nr:50S ribosomal protein L5 [Metallosphaera hakonensis]AWR99401.1 50S ribosomal protein L5 [Metallosphaera hakonensis JCM 8857 = DSM 7519]
MEQHVGKQNPMREIKISKVTVNIGLGESGERLQKAMQLLEELTGSKPVYTKAKKSIKEFDVRKGAPIGVMVTLRYEKAEEFLKRALAAVNYKIKSSSFDKHGNVSFGIAEHVVIPGTRYDPEVGIFGLDVAITFERPGFRVSRRKRQKSKIPESVRIKREESMKYLTEKFGVTIV